MNEAVQSELTLFEQDNSARIVALLRCSRDWLRCSDILERLNLPDTEANRRAVRACAEHLADELISGQAGYKCTDLSSTEEVLHFCRWMESQGDKMKKRASRTRARKGLAEQAEQ